MDNKQNTCSCGGFHDGEYQCSKCGLCSIDGEDIRYHPRHQQKAYVVDMEDMSNYMYIGLKEYLLKAKFTFN